MLSPYTGAARETFERIHTGRSYYPGKPYRSPEGLIYYINKAGFLHAYKASRSSTPDKSIIIYCLIDYRLNKDNTLTESGATYYSTPEALKEAARVLEESAALPE
jgi:hypothetical protein